MNPLQFIFQDWKANFGSQRGRIVTLSLRWCQYLRRLPTPFWWVIFPFYVIHLVLLDLYAMELHVSLKAGPGLRILHGHALVVHHGTVIGANCTLRNSVTVGIKMYADGTRSKPPVIGDDVDIGSNAVIIGPIRVGSNVVIGAGAVVVKDVPDGAVVVGNPARIVRMREGFS
jgi:serine acetyltransferase